MPETETFTPQLQEALAVIKDADNQILFLGSSLASVRYLRQETADLGRWGSFETQIPGLVVSEREADQDLVDLTQTCGPGTTGKENLGKLIKAMGKIDERAIAALIAFPGDNDRDKGLRKCFLAIVENESTTGDFRLRDLTGRAVDIMAWLKIQSDGPADLFERYQSFVDSGKIKPGQEIDLRNTVAINAALDLSVPATEKPANRPPIRTIW